MSGGQEILAIVKKNEASMAEVLSKLNAMEVALNTIRTELATAKTASKKVAGNLTTLKILTEKFALGGGNPNDLKPEFVSFIKFLVQYFSDPEVRKTASNDYESAHPYVKLCGYTLTMANMTTYICKFYKGEKNTTETIINSIFRTVVNDKNGKGSKKIPDSVNKLFLKMYLNAHPELKNAEKKEEDSNFSFDISGDDAGSSTHDSAASTKDSEIVTSADSEFMF